MDLLFVSLHVVFYTQIICIINFMLQLRMRLLSKNTVVTNSQGGNCHANKEHHHAPLYAKQGDENTALTNIGRDF